MSAEMIRESNQYISRTEIERNRSRLYRQHRSEDRVSKLKAKKKHSSSPCLRNCLRFCFKKRTDMEQREAAADLQPESIEGGLRELASKWFIETQVPLIVRNGLFPNWFLGFISRNGNWKLIQNLAFLHKYSKLPKRASDIRDAEDILKDKELGCFLIRLSDKALGYILSYKGRDRCRHFVINQSESGQFVVHGDNVEHTAVSILIEYYKEKPIEPFGEYLTTSCFGGIAEDLYDTIQVSPREKPVATVHAVKHTAQKQSNGGSEQLFTRHRGKNKTQEEVPPLPRRSRHLENASPNNSQEKVFYAQVRTKKHKDKNQSGIAPDDSRAPGPSRPPSAYSEMELSDSRCRSLPLLVSSSEEQCYRLSVASHTPPRLSPRPGRDTPSPEPPAYSRPHSAYNLDLYQLASQTSPDLGARAEDGGVYAEVPGADLFPVDDTYEQIAEHTLRPNSSPYESVDHLRAKHGPKGVKNDKWKRLFPDVKRKW